MSSVHQLEFSNDATIPLVHKHVVVPESTSPSLFSLGPSVSENCGLIGVASSHATLNEASKAATEYLALTKCVYYICSQHGTTINQSMCTPAPGGAILRDASSALTANMPMEHFINLPKAAMANETGFKTTIATGSAVGYDKPLPACTYQQIWKDSKLMLTGGKPRKFTRNGRPFVIIDEISGSNYITYAIFGVVTFEGVIQLQATADTTAPLERGIISGLSSILGVVETVVNVARHLLNVVSPLTYALTTFQGTSQVLKTKEDFMKLRIRESEVAKFLKMYESLKGNMEIRRESAPKRLTPKQNVKYQKKKRGVKRQRS